jgi:hypothetical protein
MATKGQRQADGPGDLTAEELCRHTRLGLAASGLLRSRVKWWYNSSKGQKKRVASMQPIILLIGSWMCQCEQEQHKYRDARSRLGL